MVGVCRAIERTAPVGATVDDADDRLGGGNLCSLCMNGPVDRCGAGLTTSDSISTLEQSPNSEVADACWLLTVCLHSDFSLGRLATSSELAENLYSRRRQIGVVESRGVLTVAKGKRTFQPNNRRRARVHGFRLRMRTRAGRAIVSARRGKGRKELTA